MTRAFPLTIKAKNRLWAAFGGPIGLWSQVRKHSVELSWVLAGKFCLMGANAAVMLFLANHLQLETYGLLVITISSQLLISRLLMVGVDAGMVRLTELPELRLRSHQVVSAGLFVMACTSSVLLVIVLLVTLFSPFAVPDWILWCSVAGAIGTALVDYGYSFRLARHQYPLAALAQGGTAIWRLGLTAVVAIQLSANPFAGFFAYHGSSLLSGLAQTFFIAKLRELPDRALIKRLLRYSFPVGEANVIVIFSLYQGTFLLMLLKQSAATALFGLGLTLSLGFFAIYNAYSEYLSVRIRSVEHVNDVSRFIKRALAAAVVLIVGCVPVVFAVSILVPWLLGPEWREVVPIFVYLSASMLLLILQAPLVAACHYLLKPQLITVGWVTWAVVNGVFGFILAPKLGAVGVAIAQIIGSALSLVVLSWLVVGSLRTSTAVDSQV